LLRRATHTSSTHTHTTTTRRRRREKKKKKKKKKNINNKVEYLSGTRGAPATGWHIHEYLPSLP
jgi:hypothetical protein